MRRCRGQLHCAPKNASGPSPSSLLVPRPACPALPAAPRRDSPPQLLVVLPLADVSRLGSDGWGLAEDTADSLVMIASRPQLLLLLLVYTGSLQGYNLCGMVTAGAGWCCDQWGQFVVPAGLPAGLACHVVL